MSVMIDRIVDELRRYDLHSKGTPYRALVAMDLASDVIESLQQQLAASREREKAAVALIENIHHRVKPMPRVNGDKYIPRVGIAEDVFRMIEKWRNGQEEE